MQFTIVFALLFVPSWIQFVQVSDQSQALDRIVAVVDNYVITLSDIRIEKVMREVLGEPTPQNDREVLDELIDQHLIRAQLDRYPRAEPSDAELDEAMSQIKDAKGLPPETVRTMQEDLETAKTLAIRAGAILFGALLPLSRALERRW